MVDWKGWLTVIAVVLVAAPLPSSAQTSADSGWQSVLRLQLAETKGCQLASVLFSREMRLGDHIGLEGRIRCHDGREFDFARSRAYEAFQIRLCIPTFC